MRVYFPLDSFLAEDVYSLSYFYFLAISPAYRGYNERRKYKHDIVFYLFISIPVHSLLNLHALVKTYSTSPSGLANINGNIFTLTEPSRCVSGVEIRIGSFTGKIQKTKFHKKCKKGEQI